MWYVHKEDSDEWWCGIPDTPCSRCHFCLYLRCVRLECRTADSPSWLTVFGITLYLRKKKFWLSFKIHDNGVFLHRVPLAIQSCYHSIPHHKLRHSVSFVTWTRRYAVRDLTGTTSVKVFHDFLNPFTQIPNKQLSCANTCYFHILSNLFSANDYVVSPLVWMNYRDVTERINNKVS
jgi:hypothetical protein